MNDVILKDCDGTVVGNISDNILTADISHLTEDSPTYLFLKEYSCLPDGFDINSDDRPSNIEIVDIEVIQMIIVRICVASRYGVFISYSDLIECSKEDSYKEIWSRLHSNKEGKRSPYQVFIDDDDYEAEIMLNIYHRVSYSEFIKKIELGEIFYLVTESFELQEFIISDTTSQGNFIATLKDGDELDDSISLKLTPKDIYSEKYYTKRGALNKLLQKHKELEKSMGLLCKGRQIGSLNNVLNGIVEP